MFWVHHGTTQLLIKAAQPRDKEYLLADGEGLYHPFQ